MDVIWVEGNTILWFLKKKRNLLWKKVIISITYLILSWIVPQFGVNYFDYRFSDILVVKPMISLNRGKQRDTKTLPQFDMNSEILDFKALTTIPLHISYKIFLSWYVSISIHKYNKWLLVRI